MEATFSIGRLFLQERFPTQQPALLIEHPRNQRLTLWRLTSNSFQTVLRRRR